MVAGSGRGAGALPFKSAESGAPPPCPAPFPLPRRCLSDFALTKQLYKGKASTLYQATDKVSGVVVALKSYGKRRLSDLNWYQVERGERAGEAGRGGRIGKESLGGLAPLAVDELVP